MTNRIAGKLARRKRRIERRLKRTKRTNADKYRRYAEGAGPVIRVGSLKYELADKARGVAYGGVGLMLQVARAAGLVEAIDRRVQLLKMHVPYHESDHVLNFAINAWCDGTCLQDIELRRNDEVFWMRSHVVGGRHRLRRQRPLRPRELDRATRRWSACLGRSGG